MTDTQIIIICWHQQGLVSGGGVIALFPSSKHYRHICMWVHTISLLSIFCWLMWSMTIPSKLPLLYINCTWITTSQSHTWSSWLSLCSPEISSSSFLIFFSISPLWCRLDWYLSSLACKSILREWMSTNLAHSLNRHTNIIFLISTRTEVIMFASSKHYLHICKWVHITSLLSIFCWLWSMAIPSKLPLLYINCTWITTSQSHTWSSLCSCVLSLCSPEISSSSLLIIFPLWCRLDLYSSSLAYKNILRKWMSTNLAHSLNRHTNIFLISTRTEVIICLPPSSTISILYASELAHYSTVVNVLLTQVIYGHTFKLPLFSV